LYAARAGGIDVFNGSFQPVILPGAFATPAAAAGLVPFNVQTIGGNVAVTYAPAGVMNQRNATPGMGAVATPVLSEVANSSSSRQDAPPRYRVAVPVARSALPRERFSPMGTSRTSGDVRLESDKRSKSDIEQTSLNDRV
jgi:hypothetical protein